MMPTKKFYYAINFATVPYWVTDKFAVVPSTWVSYSEDQAMVAYPLVKKKILFMYIKKMKCPDESWSIFSAAVEFKANAYKDAVLYIKLRQKLRSSYVTSLGATAISTDVIKVKDLLSTTLKSKRASDSADNSSIATVSENKISEGSDSCKPGPSMPAQQIAKKAIEHDLFMRILDKMGEVSQLLDHYIEAKRK